MASIQHDNKIDIFYFLWQLSVWQLMRKYTLSLLAKLSPDGTPIVETEILTWANQRLEAKGIKVKHFQVRRSRPGSSVIFEMREI